MSSNRILDMLDIRVMDIPQNKIMDMEIVASVLHMDYS